MSDAALRMTDRQLATIGSPPAAARQPDGELLKRFAQGRDEQAFEELVRRHGSLVMGVCQRVLEDPYDAEDAFQATFLVLAQKSSKIRNPELLGNWLYAVAYRTSRKAKRAKKSKPKSIATPEAEAAAQPGLDVALQELRSAVDHELHRLPERYRVLLMLCYFEGLSHAQAARRLGWPEGSVSRRLAKARRMLRTRLTRRGLTFSPGFVLLTLDEIWAVTPVPAALIESTTRSATALAAGNALNAVVSFRVASLARCFAAARFGSVVGLLFSSLLLLSPCSWILFPGPLNSGSDPASQQASHAEALPEGSVDAEMMGDRKETEEAQGDGTRGTPPAAGCH